MTSCSSNCNTWFIAGLSSGFASVHLAAISRIASKVSGSASLHLLSTKSFNRFSLNSVFICKWRSSQILIQNIRLCRSRKYICEWIKDLTQPTTFKPLFTNVGSVGLFPVTSSSKRTPKLYTSDFCVALPLCRYSATIVKTNYYIIHANW